MKNQTKFNFDYSRVSAPQTPASANVHDKAGRTHTFHVRVLGTEETWHTPSLLLANLPATGGKAVFSQIHLEVDPSQYEFEESKFTALKQSNSVRLEIFSDLLSTHLGMDVCSEPHVLPVYSPGFFLGRHEVCASSQNIFPKNTTCHILQTMHSSLQSFSIETLLVLFLSPCGDFYQLCIHSSDGESNRCESLHFSIQYTKNIEYIGPLSIFIQFYASSQTAISNRECKYFTVECYYYILSWLISI